MTGVWRFNSIDLCEAAFGTDLDRSSDERPTGALTFHLGSDPE